MKTTMTKLAVVATTSAILGLGLIESNAAQAANFQGSYQFGGGLFSFSTDGNLGSNGQVTGLSNFSATYSGLPSSIVFTKLVDSPNFFSLNGSSVSLAGETSNGIYFFNIDKQPNQEGRASIQSLDPQNLVVVDERYESANWRVQSVPEPTTTLPLAVLGTVFLGKKLNRKFSLAK
jgi:hypothetical protein